MLRIGPIIMVRMEIDHEGVDGIGHDGIDHEA